MNLLALKIAARRAEIDPALYEDWLYQMCYKRVLSFWEARR